MGTQMEWLFPWQAAHDESNGVDELYPEVSVGHPLYGTEVRSIAYREDCDYALFALEDGTSRVVVVHLTFQPGSNPNWPRTTFFDSLEAFASTRMVLDHENWIR